MKGILHYPTGATTPRNCRRLRGGKLSVDERCADAIRLLARQRDTCTFRMQSAENHDDSLHRHPEAARLCFFIFIFLTFAFPSFVLQKRVKRAQSEGVRVRVKARHNNGPSPPHAYTSDARTHTHITRRGASDVGGEKKKEERKKETTPMARGQFPEGLISNKETCS